MADGMSFDKYIDNPSGGSAVITNRRMYKDLYTSKFNAVLVREQRKIEFWVYHDNDNTDSYYIHMKIPSEVISEFYYDVVIKLYTTVSSKKSSTSLRQYAVGFYSNDPAFVYTFAHSFAKNKLFIKDLEPKMSKRALRERAKVRNPKDNVWYVKSLYFAYLVMERYDLFSRTKLDSMAKRYSKQALLMKIEHADKKVEARQKAAAELNKKEKQSKEKETQTRNVGVSTAASKRSPITKTAKTSKAAKQTSTTKTTKVTTMKKR